MPLFEYKVLDKENKIQTAYIEAESKEKLIDDLLSKGYYVTEINEVATKKESSFFSKLFNNVSQAEITYFYIQLSTLISSGVTLIESLESLIEQTSNPYFKKVLTDVKVKVASGQTFYNALSNYPHIFNEVAINMINAGESGAGLDVVLERIAKFLERDTKVRTKIRSAMFYPLVLCFISVFVIVFLIIYVFPKFTKVFIKSKAALPTPTVILIKVSNFLQNNYLIVIGIILFVLLFIRWLITTNIKVKTFYDNMILRVPIFGNLILKSTLARFLRTLGTLLNSGVPIIKSLEICENIVKNVVIKDIIIALRTGITQGLTLYDILKTKEIFPKIITRIVQTGEKTGTLSKLLIKASDFFEYEVEISVDNLISLIEPVLIVVMGALVGFISISMFLPIFDLTTVIK